MDDSNQSDEESDDDDEIMDFEDDSDDEGLKCKFLFSYILKFYHNIK